MILLNRINANFIQIVTNVTLEQKSRLLTIGTRIEITQTIPKGIP